MHTIFGFTNVVLLALLPVKDTFSGKFHFDEYLAGFARIIYTLITCSMSLVLQYCELYFPNMNAAVYYLPFERYNQTVKLFCLLYSHYLEHIRVWFLARRLSTLGGSLRL